MTKSKMLEPNDERGNLNTVTLTSLWPPKYLLKGVCVYRLTVLTRTLPNNYFGPTKGSSYQPEKWLTWIPSIRSNDPGPEQIFC